MLDKHGDSLPEDRVVKYKSYVEEYKKAREHLILANTRLVLKNAKDYLGRGLTYDDLFHEGILGLIRAIDGFDHKKGNRFSTYATWWIRQKMGRATKNTGRTIRLPVHVHHSVFKITKAVHSLRQELGRDPDVEEISNKTGLRADKVQNLVRYSRDVLSLDKSTSEDGDYTLLQQLEDEGSIMPIELVSSIELAEKVKHALSKLTPREAFVIRARFGLGGRKVHKLREIGEKLGLTRERARQIEVKALKKLRRNPDIRAIFNDIVNGS